MLFRPELSAHFDLFLDTRGPITELHAESLELRLVPADADTKPHAPTAQHVDLGRLLGGQHGGALGHDDDGRADAESRGHAGDEGERRHRLVMGELGGVDVGERKWSVRRPRLDDVIRNVDVTEAEVFGGLHEIADNFEISTDFSLWKMNADFHGHAACGTSVAPDSKEMGRGAGVQSR